jgi:hypothetical protein
MNICCTSSTCGDIPVWGSHPQDGFCRLRRYSQSSMYTSSNTCGPPCCAPQPPMRKAYLLVCMCMYVCMFVCMYAWSALLRPATSDEESVPVSMYVYVCMYVRLIVNGRLSQLSIWKAYVCVCRCMYVRLIVNGWPSQLSI